MIYIYFIRPLLFGHSDDSYVSTAKAEVVFIAATLQKKQSMLVSFNHNQKTNLNSTVFVQSVNVIFVCTLRCNTTGVTSKAVVL